jgi:hypothetical protein
VVVSEKDADRLRDECVADETGWSGAAVLLHRAG